MADRPRAEPISLRENAWHDNVEHEQMRDEEPDRRAHRWRYPRVGVPETTCGIESPRGRGFQWRLGRQQQRDDPSTGPRPRQDCSRRIYRQGTGNLHGHLARAR